MDADSVRSRATMWDVPRWTEHHRYDYIVVENVVEVKLWCDEHPRIVNGKTKMCSCGSSYDSWYRRMELLGYTGREVYLNSQAALVPQSRDRMYVVWTRDGCREPDLDLRPPCYCEHCADVVAGVQTWKVAKSGRRRTSARLREWGRYGHRNQYVYSCPQCLQPAIPAVLGSWSIVDHTVPIAPDRRPPRRLDPAADQDRRPPRRPGQPPAGPGRRAPLRAARLRPRLEPRRPAAHDHHHGLHGHRAPRRRPGRRREGTRRRADDAHRARPPGRAAHVRRRRRGRGPQHRRPVADGPHLRPARDGAAQPDPQHRVSARRTAQDDHDRARRPDGPRAARRHGRPSGRRANARAGDAGGPRDGRAAQARRGRLRASQPARGVTAGGNHHGLLVYNGTPGHVRGPGEPAGTVKTRDSQALLAPYNRTGAVPSPDQRASRRSRRSAETSCMVEIDPWAERWADREPTDDEIDGMLFRMLQWHELQRGQAMHVHPDGRPYLLTARVRTNRGTYREMSNEQRVMLVGNAVSSPVAAVSATRSRRPPPALSLRRRRDRTHPHQ
jgi:site-specific DNA-cytosine methylase